jgi:hypothetical protein
MACQRGFARIPFRETQRFSVSPNRVRLVKIRLKPRQIRSLGPLKQSVVKRNPAFAVAS